MNQLQPGGFSMLPPVIKNLLIINGLMWLGSVVLAMRFQIDLVDLLGLYYPNSENFAPYQLVTHIFMHAIGTPEGGLNFTHIFFNMFALWMFGSTLENVWGPKRFLIYYVICGLGAALLHLLVKFIRIEMIIPHLSPEQIEYVLQNGADVVRQGKGFVDANMQEMNAIINYPTVGASGAVFGVLLAFGMMFPNSYLYLFFAIPIKAKWFVIGYGALELFFGISNNPGDNVAHFAHLGGMLFGFLLILYWKSRGEFR